MRLPDRIMFTAGALALAFVMRVRVSAVIARLNP